jgi:hypothetical protein
MRRTIAADAIRSIQQLQQTGMLFMQTQQTQPAEAILLIHSQQAWIMVQQAGSPLVQVMHTPSLVGSHLHMPMARLQQHIIIPFIIMQQLHMPPAIIAQRFCSIVADMASSHVQVIFMPPVHFSIFILHRGTIIHWGAAGIPAVVPMGPAPAWPIPGIPIPARSITIALVIVVTSSGVRTGRPEQLTSLSRAPKDELHYGDTQPTCNIKLQEYFDITRLSDSG